MSSMFLLISSNFQKNTFKIVTITMMEIVLIKVFFFTVGSKQKNKNEMMEYHGTFIPFKSQLYSKLASPIFLLFRSWNSVLYLHVWIKSKFF